MAAGIFVFVFVSVSALHAIASPPPAGSAAGSAAGFAADFAADSAADSAADFDADFAADSAADSTASDSSPGSAADSAADSASIHIVGGSSGWIIPHGTLDYSRWASSQNAFRVGDILEFRYDPTEHTVLRVSPNGFRNCNVSGPMASFEDGRSRIRLSSPGSYFFICGVPGHCDAGQKLQIQVLRRQAGLHSLVASISVSPSASPSPSPSPSVVPSPLLLLPPPPPSPSVSGSEGAPSLLLPPSPFVSGSEAAPSPAAAAAAPSSSAATTTTTTTSSSSSSSSSSLSPSSASPRIAPATPHVLRLCVCLLLGAF